MSGSLPPSGMSQSEMREYARIAAEENAMYNRISGSGGAGAGDGSPAALKAQAEAAKLADSFANLAGNLNLGYQGMSVYNASISQGAATFGAVLNMLGPLGTAFKALGIGVGEYAISVNKQTDALYKSYQEISSVGAGGKEGLQGVFNTMQQFGLGIAELPKFNAMVKENSESLAAFGGSVQSGLKTFGNLAEGVKRTGLQTELLNLGISEEAQLKGLSSFLKTTTQLGTSQRVLSMTTEQQSKAAADYIKQQDVVTRLTGATAQQQEKALEQAMSNDRFAADRYLKEQEFDRLMASGQTEAAAALRKSILATDAVLVAVPESMKTGFQDVIANVGTQTEEGRKILNAIGEDGRKALLDQTKTAAEKLEIISNAAKVSAGDNAAFINAAGKQDFLPAFNAIIQLAGKQYNTAEGKKVDTGQKDQAAGNIELTLANYNAMVQEQVDITRKFQNTIQLGMQPLSTAMVKASEVIDKMAGVIPGSSGIARTGSQTYINDKENKERGEPVVELRQKFETVLDRDQAAAIRTDINNDLKAVGDTYHEFLDALKNRMGEWKNDILKLNPFKPSSSSTSSPASTRLSESAITRQTMDSMLAMARIGGPNNNYTPSLTNAVYNPPPGSEQETVRNINNDAAQYNREQIVAFVDMAKKLDDMIALMGKSVNIQGDTLRATYNA